MDVIKPKTVYRLEGATFPNRREIAALPGASWDKDKQEWTLDLSQMSKAAIQRGVANACYKLTRAGVKFVEVPEVPHA